MFDIGFWELALIAVVALLVIGPERLPTVMKVCGYFLGKIRRTTETIKFEIRQELHNFEIKQTLDESPAAELRKLADEVSDVADSMTASINLTGESEKPQVSSNKRPD